MSIIKQRKLNSVIDIIDLTSKKIGYFNMYVLSWYVKNEITAFAFITLK